MAEDQSKNTAGGQTGPQLRNLFRGGVGPENNYSLLSLYTRDKIKIKNVQKIESD